MDQDIEKNNAIQNNIIIGIIKDFNNIFDEYLIKDEKFSEKIKTLYLDAINKYSKLSGKFIDLFFEKLFEDKKLILNIRNIHRNMKKLGYEDSIKMKKIIDPFLESFNLYFDKKSGQIYKELKYTKPKEDREKKFLRILTKLIK